MRRRGFLLAMVLFLMLLMVVLGLGFITSRQSRYGASVKAIALGQAKSLAEAGLEDARVKMERDLDFPPAASMDQTAFSYQEPVLDPSGVLLGFYTVSIDTTYATAPYHIFRVRSTGSVGPNTQFPEGTCTISAEFDNRQAEAATASVRDPNYYRVVNWSEESQ